jgi:alpha-methylacyl-CoA racemase
VSAPSSGPLSGLKVLELGGIGPVAFAGTALADLGADVVRVERPGATPTHSILMRGRRVITADLHSDVAPVLQLAEAAAVVLEGFRPGVTERLGIGPDDVRALNRAAVYGRMAGWERMSAAASAPGHDLNYLAVSGALHLVRGSDGAPVVTPGLIGDFGAAAMTLLYGVLAALYAAQASGQGQTVDCSIVRSATTLTAAARELAASGEAEVRLARGEAPFYRAFQCADGAYVAVGALEPEFYAALRVLCGLSDPAWDDQFDLAGWDGRVAELARIFRTRTRDEWCADPKAADACVSPVLDLDEAVRHPITSSSFVTDTIAQPGVGPVLSGTPGAVGPPARPCDLADVRADWRRDTEEHT